jgi:hypothetical protein
LRSRTAPPSRICSVSQRASIRSSSASRRFSAR